MQFSRLARTRQYKYYSKQKPPANLEAHVSSEKFLKSQAYGKDKAQFAFVKTLYSQIWDTLFLHYGGFAHCWKWGGQLLALIGYGPEYEVRKFIRS